MYLLASHVYVCITDDHGVLLDLKRDKYVGIARGQMKALAACVKGWPGAGEDGASAQSSPFIKNLLTSGVLTTDSARGKAAQPVAVPRPEKTLTRPDLAMSADADLFEMRPAINSGHLVNFLRASIAARLALRWRPIASVVAKVRARKVFSGATHSADPEAIRALVAAFVYLRPLLFTTKDACLADSLALVLFLAHYRLFPNWVFGVQTGPFAAHCWVQDNDVVLNDTPDHVRRYTPILVV